MTMTNTILPTPTVSLPKVTIVFSSLPTDLSTLSINTSLFSSSSSPSLSTIETYLSSTIDKSNWERLQKKLRSEDRWTSIVGMILALLQGQYYFPSYPINQLVWYRTGLFHKPYIQYVPSSPMIPSTSSSSSSSGLPSVIRLPLDTNISHDGSIITCGTCISTSSSAKKTTIGIDILRLSRIDQLFDNHFSHEKNKNNTFLPISSSLSSVLPRIMNHLPSKIQKLIYQKSVRKMSKCTVASSSPFSSTTTTIESIIPSSSASSSSSSSSVSSSLSTDEMDKDTLSQEFSVYWTIMESLAKVSPTMTKSIHDPSIQTELENMIVRYSYDKDTNTKTETDTNVPQPSRTLSNNESIPNDPKNNDIPIQFYTLSSVSSLLDTWFKEYRTNTTRIPASTPYNDNPTTTTSYQGIASSTSPSSSSLFTPLSSSQQKLLYIHEGNDWKCWTWKISTVSFTDNVTKKEEVGTSSELGLNSFPSITFPPAPTSTTKNKQDIILSIVLQ